MLKAVIRWLFRRLYRVRVTGLEHFHEAGKRVLVVANHTSFLDGPLLWAFLPAELTFVINTHHASRKRFRPFLWFVDVVTMDPANALSTKSLIQWLQRDRPVVIFPEGRITRTGTLMKIYDGTGLVADHSDADVLPVRIDGAQYTPFSRLRGRVRLRWFPAVSLTVLAPRKITPPPEVKGRERRRRAGRLLADLMTEMVFTTGNYERTLFQAVLDARRVHGGTRVVAEDREREPVTYNQLLRAAWRIRRRLLARTCDGERVGLHMDNSTAALEVFVALQWSGCVPVLLDPERPVPEMAAFCAQMGIGLVVSADAQVSEPGATGVSGLQSVCVLNIGDLSASPGRGLRILSALAAWPACWRYTRQVPGDQCGEPAAIVIEAAADGQKRGVPLSHRNLLANIEQLATRFDFHARDVVLNVLSCHNPAGLVSGCLLPLYAGIRAFHYPRASHFRVVPEVAYDIDATVLVADDACLRAYAAHAHPYDFYSMRHVFCVAGGAQEDTRRRWMEQFGIRLYDAWTLAATTAFAAVNTPMDYRSGTAGRLLPGMEYRLETDGAHTGTGRLFLRGANVAVSTLQPTPEGGRHEPVADREGWLDTGHWVDMDKDGYLRPTIPGDHGTAPNDSADAPAQ